MKLYCQLLTIMLLQVVLLAGYAFGQLEIQSPEHFNHITHGLALGEEDQFSSVGVTSGGAGPLPDPDFAQAPDNGTVLRRARIGNSYATGVPLYFLGEIIQPPTSQADGVTPAPPGYWRSKPVRPGEVLLGDTEPIIPALAEGEYEKFYYSPHADKVFAIQAGFIEIIWVAESNPDEILSTTFTISAATRGELRTVFWTEKFFDGPRINIPAGRIQLVNPVYNATFPESVAEEYKPLGQVENPDETAQPAEELRTLWFEKIAGTGQLAAYNREGRIFVEYLGAEIAPGIHEFVGADIVEVIRAPKVEVATIDLGSQVLPRDGDTTLVGGPLLDLSSGEQANFYETFALVDGSQVYYAERENLNPDRIVFYWKEKQDAAIYLSEDTPGLEILWPKYQNRYFFVWPDDLDSYVFVHTDPVGSMVETGLQFDSSSQPEIIFQDDPSRNEAAMDFDTQRMVVDLSSSKDGFNRSLLKFASGYDIWYQPVYTQVENRYQEITTSYTGPQLNSVVTFNSTAGFEEGGAILASDSSSQPSMAAKILAVLNNTQIVVGPNTLASNPALLAEGAFNFDVYASNQTLLRTAMGVVVNKPTPAKVTVASTDGLLAGTVVGGDFFEKTPGGDIIYFSEARIESIVNNTELTLSRTLEEGSNDTTYRVESDSSMPIVNSYNVGDRIERPSEAYALAGYISGGTGYQASAYLDPYSIGVEAAAAGAIIPVNAVPGNSELTVRWFRKIESPNASFSPFYVASKVGTYTISYPSGLGEWEDAQPMMEEHEGHTSTILTDGRVLVAGGRSFGTQALASAEIFDPSTNEWTTTEPLHVGSWGHTATRLPDGKVLVVGGNGSLERAEIFDPGTGIWNQVSSLSAGRAYHAAALLDNGKVLVAGGLRFDGSSYEALSSVEVYDPETQTWSQINPLIEARGGHTLTRLRGGKVLAAGGSDVTTSELFNPATGEWVPILEAPPVARTGATATLLLDGSVLLAGGEGINAGNSATVFNPEDHTWFNTSDMAEAHSGHTATMMPDGKVLVTGGTESNLNELYDPESDTWEQAGHLPTPRRGHTATLLANGDVMIAGGSNGMPMRSTRRLKSVKLVVMASNQGTVNLSHAQQAGFIYYENDPEKPGYNPNEEHGVKFVNCYYALRDDLNVTSGEGYTSEPYILVAYTDPEDGRPAMTPFKVLREDARYSFEYPWTAGTRIQGPMPLPLMNLPLREDETIANYEVPEILDPAPDQTGSAPDAYAGFTFEDRQGYKWVYRGPHGSGRPSFGMQWYYPLRQGFHIPGHETQPEEGTVLPYLRPLDEIGSPVGDPVEGDSLIVRYTPEWPESSPSLHIAETLTLPKYGLPDVRNQMSAQILYQQSVARDGNAKPSVILHDPTRNKSVGLLDVGLEEIPESIRTTRYQGKTYFQGLPPHLQQRFYYDPLASMNGSLVLTGEFHDEIAGEDYLDLNVLSVEDELALKELAENEPPDSYDKWTVAIDELKTRLETFIEDPNQLGTYIVSSDENRTYDIGPYHLPSMPDPDTARDSYALTTSGLGEGYVTLLFGNGRVPDLTPQGDPPVMQILKVIPELYNGDLKVRLSSNPMDEKVTLRHSSDFAATPENYEFEWRHAPPTESGTQPPTYQYTANTYLGNPSDSATTQWKYARNPETALPPTEDFSLDGISIPRQLVVNNSSHDHDSGLPGLVLRSTSPVNFASGIPSKIIFSAETGDLDGFVLYINGAIALVHGNGVPALDGLVSENTYDLRLVRAESVDDLPTQGEQLFVIAELESDTLHFRVFDMAGEQVIDIDETLLTSKGPDILDLKQRLSGLWATTNLSRNDKVSVIDLAAQIVEYDLDSDFSTTLSGSGLGKQFAISGNYFKTGSNRIEVALYSNADGGAESNINLRLEGSSKLDRVDPLVYPQSPWQLATGTPIPTNRTVVGGSPTAPMGSPLLVMSDNYFTMRYRARELLADGETPNPAYALTNGEWSDWVRPALVEGWIKRVLAAINPFNQRVSDLFNNAVNTDVSMLTQAGTKWEGDIALTLEAIDEFGLIEIYETVLNRGISISIQSGYDYGPANDALLLAAGYLHDLYTILGNEAYADAANPTISIDDASTVTEVNTSRFSFEGQVASVLEEELALLRGRDDFLNPQVTQSPFYNRLFWNYTRGINSGEALYAVNYNIKEKVGSDTEDGSIDAADAQRMFPQGHGDAYGHYLTSIKGYYSLLANENFTWVPRTEALNILGNTVSVDYKDERKFAEAAANIGRTAEQIVALTHRQQFNNDPAAGWEHFRDGKENTSAPPPNKRYWGLDEWISRSAQGGYYNWVVGNAMVPELDEVHTGIQKIDRTTVPELELLAVLSESIQSSADNASDHLNPLGLSPGAIAFDIDPVELREGYSHYEQVYERALNAVLNAKGSFDQAATMTRLLRNQENQIDDFNTSIEEQERAFKYQLIDIYGNPYPRDIGPGKTYAQGYTGPDLINWFVIDRPTDLTDTTESVTIEARVPLELKDDANIFERIFNPLNPYPTQKKLVHISANPFGQFADEWAPDRDLGSRAITGRTQQALINAQLAYIALIDANDRLDKDYYAFDGKRKLLSSMIDYHTNVQDARKTSRKVQNALSLTKITLEIIADKLDRAAWGKLSVSEAATEAFPKVMGFSTDTTSAGRSATKTIATIGAKILQFAIAHAEGEAKLIGKLKEWEQYSLMIDLENYEFTFEEQKLRYETNVMFREIIVRYHEISKLALELQQAVEEVRTVMAQGDRIQLEREIFRKRAATLVQGYRTKDLTFRVFRNEALEQYRTLFDLAARYTYLAANSYDYETGLLGTDEGQAVISDIVSSRALGDLTNDQPQATVSTLGDAGLAGTMAQLQADWSVVEGRLGINNPDTNGTLFSLRKELFRIMDDPDSTEDDEAWQQVLEQHMVSDIMLDPDAATYCLGLENPDGTPVPGIVIPFSTTIEHGKNFFGLPLAGGDHAYSASTFATKIYALGAVFEGYVGMDPYREFIPIPNQPMITEPNSSDPNALSATPYMYVIPTGVDHMRAPPLGDTGSVRSFMVHDQALPLPFNLGANAFSTTEFFNANGTLTEQPWILRKHQAFRAVDDPVFFYGLLRDEFQSSRLVGRSVWNTNWKIIIPAYALLSDEHQGMNRFAASVDDIKLFLRTYSHSGN